MDDSLTQPLSPSLAEHSPSQPPEQSVQATEQQLKARAEGVSIEVCSLPNPILGSLLGAVSGPAERVMDSNATMPWLTGDINRTTSFLAPSPSV